LISDPVPPLPWFRLFRGREEAREKEGEGEGEGERVID